MSDRDDAPPDADLSLVPPGFARGVTVELTSRCNLRCAYCSVPHAPGYGAADMSQEQRDAVLRLAAGRTVDFSLSGRGELTYIDGWQDIVEDFAREEGHTRHVVTNLSKPLSFDDALVLSRFDFLTFSIDTADAETLKRIRKSVDLRTVLANITLLRAAALEQGRSGLRFNIIGVINETTLFGVKRLVALAIALGASDLILQDLVMDYSDRTPGLPVRHISTLPRARLREGAVELMMAQDLAQAHGLGFSVHAGIAEACNEAMYGVGAPSRFAAIDMETRQLGSYRRNAVPTEPGETRMCTMPWTMLLLAADGGVEACCGAYGQVASWTGAASLDEIANAPGIRRMRQQLLEGDLPEACRVCGSAPRGSVTDFRAAVRALLAGHASDPQAT